MIWEAAGVHEGVEHWYLHDEEGNWVAELSRERPMKARIGMRGLVRDHSRPWFWDAHVDITRVSVDGLPGNPRGLGFDLDGTGSPNAESVEIPDGSNLVAAKALVLAALEGG